MSSKKKKKDAEKIKLNKKKAESLISLLKGRFSAIKGKIKTLKYRRLYLFSVVIAIGISFIPTSIVLGTESQLYADDNLVKKRFSSVLKTVKNSFEGIFSELLDEMNNDPLDGLYSDKMPTAEEIFYEEWANDRFPSVLIPVIGGYIEEIGTEKVGDINLDNQDPPADLNLSSSNNPSGISQEQCQALWNNQIENSLTSGNPTLWFSALEGNSNSQTLLKLEFNITENQLDLICNWITVGKNTWIKYLSQEERITFILPLFLGLLIPGLALIGYGVYKIRPEIQKLRKKKNGKLQKKKGLNLKTE